MTQSVNIDSATNCFKNSSKDFIVVCDSDSDGDGVYDDFVSDVEVPVNKLYHVYSSISQPASCRAGQHRTNNSRHKLHQSRAYDRLGQSIRRVPTIPKSGMQIRNIRRQVAIPAVSYTHLTLPTTIAV